MATADVPDVSETDSDESHPFSCSPCSRQDLEKGAEVYCKDCMEYFCGGCLKEHGRFAIMATHKLLDRAQMEAMGPQKVQPMQNVPCDQHPGNFYTMFCEGHQQVCCAVCSRLTHKFCDIKYLSDVTYKPMQTAELNDYKRTLQEVLQTLEKIKSKREVDKQRLGTEKVSEIEKIKVTNQQVANFFADLEKSAIDKICSKYSAFNGTIENDVKGLDMIFNYLRNKLDSLDKAKNEAEIFFYSKLCGNSETNAKALIKKIETRKEERIAGQDDQQAEDVIKKMRSFADLILGYRYIVTPNELHVIDNIGFGSNSDIADVCRGVDNAVLIMDQVNKSLVRFDNQYKFVDRVQFNSVPKGVCSIPDGRAAVTFPDTNIVYIVKLGETMTEDTSFKTSDVCNYIAHYAAQLFVVCGRWSNRRRRQVHIAVFAISGVHIRNISPVCLYEDPIRMAVRSDGVILLGGNRLHAIGQDGRELWTVSCKDMGVSRVDAIAFDSYGQIFSSSCLSGKIVLITKDGRVLGEVLANGKSINSPRSLCVDKDDSTLVVGMQDTTKVCVFDLRRKLEM